MANENPPITSATLQNYKKQLAMETLAASQRAANAANMKGYSSEVGAATGAGGPLDISNVPMVAGLSNRYSGIGNALGLQYKSNVQKLQGMGQYISGQRQYMRWRYPSRYGISRSGRQTYSLPTPIMLQLPKPLLPITSTPTPSGNIDKVGS